MVIFDKCKVCGKGSMGKAKKSINVVSFKNAIVYICDMSCIYGRYESLILSEFFFSKEIEFAIVELVHHYLKYCIMFVCNLKATTLFWRLQQVNQFIWELPPPPPPATGILH